MGINSGSIINHCTLIRVSVQGEGNLIVISNSFRQVRTRESASIVMTDPMDKIGSTLSNFSSQRIQIEIATDAYGEWFKFSDIIPFIKPTATSYPE